MIAANSTSPSARADEDLVEAADALATAESKVGELTASFDELLGLPLDTQLELVPPTTRFDDISLKQATDAAMSANPEVVEAEQNVVKARAANTLSKLDYVPDIVAMGGYAYNSNAIPLLPRDFSFIGLMGSYNRFDFGKREHTAKELSAQPAMAQTGVELTKARVAAAVKSSYFAMQRYRELSELRHQLASTAEVRRVGLSDDDPDSLAVRTAEAAAFQADLDYREALSELKGLMGAK